MEKGRRANYPDNWDQISRDFRASKNHQCEDCGVRKGDRMISRRTGVVWTAYVVAAHAYGEDTRNPHAKLRCLCPRCHFIYDLKAQQRDREVSNQRLQHQLLRR